jgi:UDP-N-acetyl-D-glucosamine/UDP-N-acetyl-D-galactosamine dehydrogenase
MNNNLHTIAIIGLGYVGLPLAVEFGKKHTVIGFDIDCSRIAELQIGHDATQEVDRAELETARYLSLSNNQQDLAKATVYIVTVPTPIDIYKRPDLSALMEASKMIGQVLKPDDIVIYESTVYPGATEEDCVPVLERVSGLTFNEDFFVGYSPERINPGDKKNRLSSICKVTSGSTPEVAEIIDKLYSSIITAGTFKADSIRVAEAAKVIENTQRDLNIALVNELAIIFDKMGIDTDAVLKTAGTKWNFQPFSPGLVGGHCIGVDPYYLTHKAEELGYMPQVILAGRRINDGMGAYVAHQLVKKMLKKRIVSEKAKVLILGLAFKENCCDLRNTRVLDIINELREYGMQVDIHDEIIDPIEAKRDIGIDLINSPTIGEYHGIVLAVPHENYVKAGVMAIRQYGRKGHVFFDVKSVFAQSESNLRL